MRRLLGAALVLGAVAPAWAAPDAPAPAPAPEAPPAEPTAEAPAAEAPPADAPAAEAPPADAPAAEALPTPAGKAAPARKGKKPTAPVAAAIAQSPSELPPGICTAPGDQLHVLVKQPDNSTYASGPGECWLTLDGKHPTSPVRIYVTFESPGKRMGAQLGDTAKDAIQWAKDHDLFRGKVEELESGQIPMGDQAASYHLLRGLPFDGDTTREAVFAHLVAGGQDIIVVAHYDAFHPGGLNDEAALAIRGMSVVQGERPRLVATPPPPEDTPPPPEGGPVPSGIGEVPTEGAEPAEPVEPPPPPAN